MQELLKELELERFLPQLRRQRIRVYDLANAGPGFASDLSLICGLPLGDSWRLVAGAKAAQEANSALEAVVPLPDPKDCRDFTGLRVVSSLPASSAGSSIAGSSRGHGAWKRRQQALQAPKSLRALPMESHTHGNDGACTPTSESRVQTSSCLVPLESRVQDPSEAAALLAATLKGSNGKANMAKSSAWLHIFDVANAGGEDTDSYTTVADSVDDHAPPLLRSRGKSSAKDKAGYAPMEPSASATSSVAASAGECEDAVKIKGSRKPLSLRHAKMGYVDMDLLKLALRQDTQAYHEVDFSQNRISADGIGLVLNLCMREPTCSSLRIVRLSNNVIDDHGAYSIADMCKKCYSLLDVDLSHNNFTDLGAEFVVAVAAKHRPMGRDIATLRLRLESNNIAKPSALLERLTGYCNVTSNHCDEGYSVLLPDIENQLQDPLGSSRRPLPANMMAEVFVMSSEAPKEVGQSHPMPANEERVDVDAMLSQPSSQGCQERVDVDAMLSQPKGGQEPHIQASQESAQVDAMSSEAPSEGGHVTLIPVSQEGVAGDVVQQLSLDEEVADANAMPDQSEAEPLGDNQDVSKFKAMIDETEACLEASFASDTNATPVQAQPGTDEQAN